MDIEIQTFSSTAVCNFSINFGYVSLVALLKELPCTDKVLTDDQC